MTQEFLEQIYAITESKQDDYKDRLIMKILYKFLIRRLNQYYAERGINKEIKDETN